MGAHFEGTPTNPPLLPDAITLDVGLDSEPVLRMEDGVLERGRVC